MIVNVNSMIKDIIKQLKFKTIHNENNKKYVFKIL